MDFGTYRSGVHTCLVYLADTALRDETVTQLKRSAPNVRMIYVVSNLSSEQAVSEREYYLSDPKGLLASRYELKAQTTYLIRPDQHVCARWRQFEPELVYKAYRKALGHFLDSDNTTEPQSFNLASDESLISEPTQ